MLSIRKPFEFDRKLITNFLQNLEISMNMKRRLSAFMAFALAILAISGCGKDEKEDPAPTTIKVTGVSIDRQTVGMTEGETAYLAATVAPANASDKSVSWTSSAKEVATVDNDGNVTAVKAGETTEDGGHTATCTVTVLKRVTGVTLDKTSITIVKGGTAKLTATVTPYSAADKNVTWKSSDEKIATVDESGNVLGIGFGTTSVTVTTEDGGFTAACEVRVTLASPEITNAVAGEDNIKVEWNSVSGATSYEVGYKKTDASGWNVSGTVLTCRLSKPAPLSKASRSSVRCASGSLRG